MTPPRWRAVTLDAAGTLIDVAEPVGAVYARTAARHGIVRPPATIEVAFRTAMSGAPPLAFPGLDGATLGAAERSWWRAVVHAALGSPPPDERFEACVDALMAHYGDASAWHVFPEVPGVLESLRRAGIPSAVVSNFDRRLGPLLGALGLTPLLDATIASSEAGAAKPAGAIWHVACRHLGVGASETLHVGDQVDVDVTGALRAGLGAAMLDRAGRAPALPAGVPSLPDLRALPALVRP